MTAPITCFKMTRADLDDAAQMVTHLRTDMNGHVVCSVEDMRAVLEKSLEEETYQGYVARQNDGTSVGYLGLNQRFAIYSGGLFFQVTELFVPSFARRLGVGRLLLKTAESKAVKRGATSIEIGAPKQQTHPQTHAFYQAQGYLLSGPRLSKTLS